MKILHLLVCLLMVLSCSDGSNFSSKRPVDRSKAILSTTAVTVDEDDDLEIDFPANSEDGLTDPLQIEPNLSSETGDCQAKPMTGAQGIQLEQGHENIFLVQTQEVSFCDLLLASGKDTALLQYLPSDCLNCEQEIQNVSWAIDRSAYNEMLTHIVVLPENNPALVEQISAYLVSKALPAKLVVDEQQLFNGEISQKKLLSDNPKLITVNAHLEYDFIRSTEPLYLKIVPAAEAVHLSVIGSEQLPEKTPASSWDGETQKTTGLLDIFSITQFDAVGGQ